AVLHDDRVDRRHARAVAKLVAAIVLGGPEVVPVALRKVEAQVEPAADRAQPEDPAVQHGIRCRPVRWWRAGEDLTACLDLHVGPGAAVVPGPKQELSARDQLVCHAAGTGIAGEAVAGERGARRAGAAVTRLESVADGVVVAGRAVDLVGVL